MNESAIDIKSPILNSVVEILVNNHYSKMPIKGNYRELGIFSVSENEIIFRHPTSWQGVCNLKINPAASLSDHLFFVEEKNLIIDDNQLNDTVELCYYAPDRETIRKFKASLKKKGINPVDAGPIGEFVKNCRPTFYDLQDRAKEAVKKGGLIKTINSLNHGTSGFWNVFFDSDNDEADALDCLLLFCDRFDKGELDMDMELCSAIVGMAQVVLKDLTNKNVFEKYVIPKDQALSFEGLINDGGYISLANRVIVGSNNMIYCGGEVD